MSRAVVRSPSLVASIRFVNQSINQSINQQDGRHNVRKHIKNTFDMHLCQLREGVVKLRDDMNAFAMLNERYARLNDDLVYRISQLDTKFRSVID